MTNHFASLKSEYARRRATYLGGNVACFQSVCMIGLRVPGTKKETKSVVSVKTSYSTYWGKFTVRQRVDFLFLCLNGEYTPASVPWVYAVFWPCPYRRKTASRFLKPVLLSTPLVLWPRGVTDLHPWIQVVNYSRGRSISHATWQIWVSD